MLLLTNTRRDEKNHDDLLDDVLSQGDLKAMFIVAYAYGEEENQNEPTYDSMSRITRDGYVPSNSDKFKQVSNTMIRPTSLQITIIISFLKNLCNR